MCFFIHFHVMNRIKKTAELYFVYKFLNFDVKDFDPRNSPDLTLSAIHSSYNC